jgi:hypothetical protein
MVGQANRARSEAPVQARGVMLGGKRPPTGRVQTRTVSGLSFELAAAQRSAPPPTTRMATLYRLSFTRLTASTQDDDEFCSN